MAFTEFTNAFSKTWLPNRPENKAAQASLNILAVASYHEVYERGWTCGRSTAPHDWQTREINRLTQKRRKHVILAVHQELFFALEAERKRRNPALEDCVLLNPETNRPLTRPRLYERIIALGREAGFLTHFRIASETALPSTCSRAEPHRMTWRSLGDTVETVEKHYAPFVRELRERARRIMESGKGLEITGTQRAQQKTESRRLQ
jgi:hypothetical protein